MIQDLIDKYVFGDEQPTEKDRNECLDIIVNQIENGRNILTKQGKSFKVHNTWGLHATWNDGGQEKLMTKILNTLKSTLKDGTDLGRVKRSYIEDSDDVLWFCYETKDNTIRVSLYGGMNLNRGTWYNINEIKIV